MTWSQIRRSISIGDTRQAQIKLRLADTVST
jgi:hypothetical protein